MALEGKQILVGFRQTDLVLQQNQQPKHMELNRTSGSTSETKHTTPHDIDLGQKDFPFPYLLINMHSL